MPYASNAKLLLMGVSCSIYIKLLCFVGFKLLWFRTSLICHNSGSDKGEDIFRYANAFKIDHFRIKILINSARLHLCTQKPNLEITLTAYLFVEDCLFVSLLLMINFNDKQPVCNLYSPFLLFISSTNQNETPSISVLTCCNLPLKFRNS